MSAIGDYVHYTATGYEKHGITKKGSPVFYNYVTLKNNIMNRMNKSQLTKKDTKELQKAINLILSDDDTSGDVTKAIRGEIKSILQDRFAESMGKINWDTGNVSAATVNAAKGSTTSKIQTDANQNDIQLKTIISRIRALEQARNALTNNTKKDELTTAINNIYKQLNSILTDGKKNGMIGYLRNVKIREGQAMQGNVLLSLNNETQNLVTQINTLMKTYAAVPAINLQKGDLFEYVIALAPAIARINAGESMEDVFNELKSTVAGGDRSRLTIDFDKNEFTKNLDVNKLDMKNYIISETNRTAISYGTSQEKIDINLSWEGKTIPISAKNVKLGSGFDIHILSGSSLLYLIQDENPDFINHYFNIIAQHGAFINREPIDNAGRLSGDYSAAHEAMKCLILFKALSGQTFGRQGADIFIVNDNSQKGGVRVLEISDIIKKALTHIDRFVSIDANGQSLEQMKIRNNWNNNNYSNRITDFISNVHQQKINAALKANEISKMK